MTRGRPPEEVEREEVAMFVVSVPWLSKAGNRDGT